MIRVLIVDDSLAARRLFARALCTQKDIEVAGDAPDPYVARDRILELRPDVIVLDVEMPRMDGIEFLRRLMQHMPLPVVICSSSAVAGGETALRALRAGAIEVVEKPQGDQSAERLARELCAAVRAAAAAGDRIAKLARVRTSVPAAARERERERGDELDQDHDDDHEHERARRRAREPVAVIGIGASTGGTVAVEAVVRSLPAIMPPVVIVQHMPAYITAAFAQRLAQTAKLKVEEAREGVALTSGVVLVAPGGMHLVIERTATGLRARVRNGPRVNGHVPSVDVLFRSIADSAGAAAIGVLLTGMGRDGADGLLAMRKQHARTLAQDEASSVVWGMPKAAIDLGAAEEIVPLAAVGARLARIASGLSTRSAQRA